MFRHLKWDTKFCQYNPIVIIWAQVKRQIATKNVTFKMVDVESLMHKVSDSVTNENWVNYVIHHIENIKGDDYDKEKTEII